MIFTPYYSRYIEFLRNFFRIGSTIFRAIFCLTTYYLQKNYDFVSVIKTARDNGRFALRLEASATGHGLKAYWIGFPPAPLSLASSQRASLTFSDTFLPWMDPSLRTNSVVLLPGPPELDSVCILLSSPCFGLLYPRSSLDTKTCGSHIGTLNWRIVQISSDYFFLLDIS